MKRRWGTVNGRWALSAAPPLTPSVSSADISPSHLNSIKHRVWFVCCPVLFCVPFSVVKNFFENFSKKCVTFCRFRDYIDKGGLFITCFCNYICSKPAFFAWLLPLYKSRLLPHCCAPKSLVLTLNQPRLQVNLLQMCALDSAVLISR